MLWNLPKRSPQADRIRRLFLLNNRHHSDLPPGGTSFFYESAGGRFTTSDGFTFCVVS